jgi:hypothetical protein
MVDVTLRRDAVGEVSLLVLVVLVGRSEHEGPDAKFE